MIMRTLGLVAAAATLALTTAPTRAEGLGVEGNYARATGRWGGEFGAGYALGLAGFSLTPSAGLFVRDGGTKAYGRIEAAYQIPLSARIGAGVRFSGDDPRPYATAALPVLPLVAVKGNVGPKYVALGLTVGY
jgi:hypothetical protein